MKKNYWLLFILILVTAVSGYSQTVIDPAVKTPTSFAIIIDSTSSVSYTHLDVYKRQGYGNFPVQEANIP